MLVAGIDTHRTVKRLREAGFSDEQAETVSDIVRDAATIGETKVATKSDLETVRVALKGDIDKVRSDLKADIDKVRTDLKADIEIALAKADAKNEQRFGRIESDILVLKWMVGVVMAGIVSLIIKAWVP